MSVSQSEGWKIIQITPAPPGWFARYINEGSEPAFKEPIACWALAENSDGEKFVTGIICVLGMDFAEDAKNFFDYWHADMQHED